jgi:solute carrier family 25 oxoglutarate transporter 11
VCLLNKGVKPYTSMMQCVTVIAKAEGVASLWNGFLPYFARCGGHTVTMFLFLEQYKKAAALYWH